MVAGRNFTDHDDVKAMKVAVINQTMARRRWPSEDPIGKRITFDHGQTWTTIEGIAGDAREYGFAPACGRRGVSTPVAERVRREHCCPNFH